MCCRSTSSQLLRPGLAVPLGGNPRFTYSVQSFGLTDDTSDTIDATALFNPFTPALSTGMFDTVAPNAQRDGDRDGQSGRVGVHAGARLMVVTHENPSGQDEAQLIPVGKSQH